LKYFNKFIKILKVFVIILFFFSCNNGKFYIYEVEGNNNLTSKTKYNQYTDKHNIPLFFDRSAITDNYKEISIIATNNYFYGEFFFDKVFMNLLNKKAASLNADALIYEKDFSEFTNYKKDFIYFTLIQYEK